MKPEEIAKLLGVGKGAGGVPVPPAAPAPLTFHGAPIEAETYTPGPPVTHQPEPGQVRQLPPAAPFTPNPTRTPAEGQQRRLEQKSAAATRRAGKGTLEELGLVAPKPGGAPPAAPAPAPAPIPTPATTVEPAPTPPICPPDVEELLVSIPQASFITGQAGTGKTFLVQERVRQLGTDRVILCATTGIAAVNLGENVVTINSLLGFFDTHSLRDLYTTGRLDQKLMKLAAAGVHNIVLDEVSMMDGDQLSLLQASLDTVNEARYVANEPPLKLTLTGDFLQLPPVRARFAFEVEAWRHYEANTTKLEKVWRQVDPAFLRALADARAGRGTAALQFFYPLVKPLLDPNFPGITLMAKNDAVDRYNSLKLRELPGTIIEFPTQLWGEQRSEWKNVPAKLPLKPGALVMILANRKSPEDRDRFLYVNGDLGDIQDFDVDRGTVWVRLRRNGMDVPVTYVTRDNKIPLEPGRAKQLRAEGHEDRIKDRYEIIGGMTYMPLRPAWASTVHKSQGLTLDNVQLDVRDTFFRSAGMIYVALSRVRSPQGLRVVGNPKVLQSRINVDPRVRRFV